MAIGHNGGPMAEGWIARHRTVRNHPLVGHGLRVNPADPSRPFCASKGEAWEDMIMTCNYADGRVRNGGHWMELRRGELVGAVSYLAQRWNWTPKVVRKFLDDLENDGMITLKKPGAETGVQKGKQSTVISLCNYDTYQSIPTETGQANGQAEGTQGASKGQAEGNKNNKETIKQDKRALARDGQENGRDYWATAMAVPGQYNANDGVTRDPATGSILLFNGTRQEWLTKFGGDAEALDLALKQVANYVQPNAYKPIKTQVEAQLAGIVRQEREKQKRYEAAKQSKPQGETAAERRARLLAQIRDEEGRR